MDYVITEDKEKIFRSIVKFLEKIPMKGFNITENDKFEVFTEDTYCWFGWNQRGKKIRIILCFDSLRLIIKTIHGFGENDRILKLSHEEIKHLQQQTD